MREHPDDKHRSAKAAITVRLPVELIEELDRHCKLSSAGRWRNGERLTKSGVVEEALAAYLRQARRG